jgi:CheY-like chemotaxis protein
VDLPEVILTAVALTRPRWKEEMEAKGVAITVRTEISTEPPVLGEAHELRRLLINLILNSVDAMPRGGSISIRLRPHATGRQAVLEVQDTGVGMSDDVKLKCMDPFFTTKSGRGVGLGLSVSHGIVQRHKWSIEVQSAPGQGTIVTVHLSLTGAPERAALQHGKAEGRNADRSSAGPPVRPLRVLFVDDEESARRLLRRYLESDGHTVELAIDGLAGLASFKAGRFDVAILDRAMPGMSGDELAVAIKERSARTPVIILTGFDDVTVDRRAADMVIRKPLTRDVLRRALAEVMSPAQGNGLHAG